MAKEKEKELAVPAKKMSFNDIISSLRKEYKDDEIIRAANDVKPIPRTSTGIMALDVILGGGLPDGRIIEAYGPESSGKTTIALHCIAAAQKAGKICGYVDAEHAFDPVYAKNVGVDISQLLVSAPLYGEQSLAVVDSLIRTGSVGLIVVDSVAALVPKKELDGEFGDSNVGLHARLMSQAMRKLTPLAEKTGCTIIFINQIREKVGVMYGSPETTTGGRALKFYSSIRLDVRKKEALKDGTDIYANKTQVKTVKNKTFPPMKVTMFDIIFGKGVDNVGAVIDVAAELDVIEKGGGGNYTYKGVKRRGRGNMIDFFSSEEGRGLFDELEKEVTAALAQDSAEMMSLSAEEIAKTQAQLDEEEKADKLMESKAKQAGIDVGGSYEETSAS